jgi:hypothetical protein
MPFKYNALLGLGLDDTIPLDGAGKIPSTFLPSYVDDVEEYNNLAAFPATGETGKIYVAIDTGFAYRWSGSVYVQIGITAAAGATTQVQFNDAGAFGGDSGLTFNKTTDALSAGGFIPTSSTVPANGIYLPAANSVAVATNGAGRLFVDASGNVGVGTSAPGYPLTVLANGAANTNNVVGHFYNYNSYSTRGLYIYNGRHVASGRDNAQVTFDVQSGGSNGTMLLQTDGNTALIIDGSQRVGIGTTLVGNSANQLSVRRDSANNIVDALLLNNGSVDNAAGTGVRINFSGVQESNSDIRYAYIESATSSVNNDHYIAFGTNAAGVTPVERLRITSAGLVGIGTSSPGHKFHVVSADTTTPGFFQHIDGTTTLGNSFSTIHRAANDGNNRYSLSAWQVQNDSGLTQRAFIGSRAVAGAANYNPLMVFGTTTGSGTYDTRMVIDGSGKVGIGTTSPGSLLHLAATGTSTNAEIIIAGTNTNGDASCQARIGATQDGALTSAALTFSTRLSGTTSERGRFDSSGRLLVGTSTARANFYNTGADANLQLEGVSGARRASIISCEAAATAGGGLVLAHQRSGTVGGNTIVQNADIIGRVTYQGNDGTQFVEAASINCEVDGTPGANDMPGRLVFSTTADGAASPTERMRITSGGEIQFGDSSTRNRAITSETDYYASGRNRLTQSWFVLRKAYKATGSSVAAEATITLSASAGSPEAFHKIRVIQSGALTSAYYEFLVSESSSTFSVVQDLSDYNKAQFTVSMSSPILTITSGTAAVDFVYLQVEIETFAMGAAEPTISFATV